MLQYCSRSRHSGIHNRVPYTASPPSPRNMTSEAIDELLVRYLGLLDEYTQLRASLVTHQVAMYGQLTRANFAAERGFRYGPDHFDGRMQATARLEILSGTKEDDTAGGAAAFSISRPGKPTATATQENAGDDAKDAKEESKADGSKKTAGEARLLRDPLQWFGVLAPMALRLAQKEAIEAVDKVVPRLASVSAEMAAVEIEVRRARKKRARAEAARDREQQVLTPSITKQLDETGLGAAA